MTHDGKPRILLVDDHDIVAAAVAATRAPDGAPLTGPVDSYPELATPPRNPRVRFKWIKDPEVAARFLKQEAMLGRWQPDIILIDFEFLGTPSTGLGVLAAARHHAPEARVAIFSGHSPSNGRSLFAAAAYHWFDVPHDITKSDAGRELADLFSPDPARRPRIHPRIAANAKLIDAFFTQPCFVEILRSWPQTNGQERAIEKRVHASRRSVSRYKDELTRAAAAFEGRFGVADIPSNLSQAHAARVFLGQFVTNNQQFFSDPALPEIVAHLRHSRTPQRA